MTNPKGPRKPPPGYKFLVAPPRKPITHRWRTWRKKHLTRDRLVTVLGAVVVLAVMVAGIARVMYLRSLGRDTRTFATCGQPEVERAVRDWFAVVSTGDIAPIATLFDRGFIELSVAPFAPADSPFVARAVDSLVPYVRRRAAKHERLTLDTLFITTRHESYVEFFPIYLRRQADDLGPAPLAGTGKGIFRCGGGLVMLNLAPRAQ